MMMEIPVDERTYERLRKVAAETGTPVCDLLTQLVLTRITKEENDETR